MDLRRLLDGAVGRLVTFRDGVRGRRITPAAGAAEIRRHLARQYGEFATPVPPERLLDDVAAMMSEWNLHVTHPRYFGLFNPPVFPAAVAADLLVAGFNPQLAAWSHAPAANEIERHTLRYLAGRLGLDAERTAASFASGGAEANHSALLVALTDGLPGFRDSGLAGANERPVVYVTSESHHSIEKAAHLSGLGRRAVRTVATDPDLRMSVVSLAEAVAGDRRQGRRPLVVVGTAGTTAGGTVDPLAELAGLCEAEGLWFHVDAAWGGAACLSPRLAPVLVGIERADSVTWDAHKWLSVPMGGGMFFCSRPGAVERTFGTRTGYMPLDVDSTADPYSTTIQWSRRHIGLKLFLSLAALGADGYRRAIEHQAEIGERLRRELELRGWRIVNRTPLPVVCFSRGEIDRGTLSAGELAARLAERNFWVSPVSLAGGRPVLRACITSYETTAEDVAELAEAATTAVAAG